MPMKTSIFFLSILLLTVSCQKKDPVWGPSNNFQSKAVGDSVQDIIRQSIVKAGFFEWSQLSPSLLWSAIKKSNGMVSIGYKKREEKFSEAKIDQIDIQDENWSIVREELLSLILFSASDLTMW
mgnify:FL=1